jgi:hypothetical protein
MHEPTSTQLRRKRRAVPPPPLAAFLLSALGFLAIGLSGAHPAIAADATMSPFTAGRHVYDYGRVLSAKSATRAESLAAHIEAEGGGRTVIYTAANSSELPTSDTLATAWHVNGLLLTAAPDGSAALAMGTTLQDELNSDMATVINDQATPAGQTAESWIMSSLARVDAFMSGTHVFDAPGVLDASSLQKAESAATDMSTKIKTPVYIDISIGGTDPATSAISNARFISGRYDDVLIIALAVSGNRIGGQIDATGDADNQYGTGSPWAGDVLSAESAANENVQASVLTAIDAVHANEPSPVMSFVGSPWGEMLLTSLAFIVLFGLMLLLMRLLIARQTS